MNIFQDLRRNRFYRIRYDANDALTQRKQMFHIPFESRGLVSPQRYSIPGFPGLYLGSSVYACLEELRKLHDTSNLFVSSYKIKDRVNIIDLGYPPRVAKDASYKIKDHQESFLALKAYYLCWPLLAACSVKVKEDKHTFKSEYIIPQLLLQWVRASTDFSGIRYFTSRNYSYVKSVHLYQNYVFPVEQIQEEGYCEKLIEAFELTDPIPFDTYRAAFESDSSAPIYLAKGRKGYVDDGEQAEYRSTYYAYLEEELERMEHARLANCHPIA